MKWCTRFLPFAFRKLMKLRTDTIQNWTMLIYLCSFHTLNLFWQKKLFSLWLRAGFFTMLKRKPLLILRKRERGMKLGLENKSIFSANLIFVTSIFSFKFYFAWYLAKIHVSICKKWCGLILLGTFWLLT